MNIEPSAIQEKSSSSWFSNFSLPTNLTNQLSNISSAIFQTTSKVGTVTNTFIQEQPLTSKENEQQCSEANKNFNSMLASFIVRFKFQKCSLFRNFLFVI